MNLIKKLKNTFNKNGDSQGGFTLLELLTAMIIFLIVTTAVYGLLNVGRIASNRSSQRTDVLKNARTAIHLIGRDALNAGLGYHQTGAIVPDDFISNTLGLPKDKDNQRDLLTSVIAGNDLFTNDLIKNDDKTDIIAFAYRDMDFNTGGAIELENSLALVSSPETASLKTKKNSTAAMKKHDLVLVESDSTQLAVMLTGIPDSKSVEVAPGDALSINQSFDGVGVKGSMLKKCTTIAPEHCTTYLASLKRFFWVSYKIKEDGTLVRIVYGNNTGQPFDEQIQEQPLAYNVRNLQIKYLLADGTLTDKPSAGSDGIVGTNDDEPYNFNLIRQIIVRIEVESNQLNNATREPELLTIDSTFGVRNLQYDIG